MTKAEREIRNHGPCVCEAEEFADSRPRAVITIRSVVRDHECIANEPASHG